MRNYNSLFEGIYKDKTVLVTGHTGFKGSWLVLWLLEMGAKVIGYSKNIPSNPAHFELLMQKGFFKDLIDIRGDIRDSEKLEKVFGEYKPDIVFHLAAQPLVRYSYENPVDTYETNVIGILKVFEVCKKSEVKAIVNITSDKCYKNREWVWGYRENDRLGGYDPYSSSKACAEILTDSYRNTYFNLDEYGKTHNTLLASCRAGNVIGGGDWAKDRLVTDIVLSASKNEKVLIRNPDATRPWQHVLEPLSGYLLVGQKLLEGKKEFAGAWNFGPNDEGNIKVIDVLKEFKNYWDNIEWEIDKNTHPHEAKLLKLDCSKANFYLNWKPVWDSKKAFEKTVTWYKEFYESEKILTENDLCIYIEEAYKKGLIWVK
jgi:CDP-glucose 4,6-dehydratase